MIKIEEFGSSSNGDDYTTNGIYYLNSARTLTNIPSGEDSGVLIVIHPVSTNPAHSPYYGWHQFWLERKTNKIYVRCKWSGESWTTWKEI